MRGKRIRLVAAVTCALLGAVALGSLVPTATGAHERPNVVLILTDDQINDVSKMPFLSSRRDWLRFRNAFSNVPLCCPSRATILTGLYSHHTGIEGNANADRFDDSSTVATWLHDAGYETGFFGKYLNAYPWKKGNYVPPGWSRWSAFAGEPDYYNYSLIQDGTRVSHGNDPADYSTDVLAGQAAAFVRTARAPFFLAYAPLAPHGPTKPAPRHQGVFRHESVTLPPNLVEADVSDKPAWVRRLPVTPAGDHVEGRRNQWETLLAVDEAIARIHETLRLRGQLSRTIFVYMTDNGLSQREHRWHGKGCEYEECVRTPFLVRHPDVDAKEASSRRVDGLISNADVAPTIADFAGVDPPPVDGRSIQPLVRGTARSWRSELLLRGEPQRAYDGNGPPHFWAIRTPALKYVELDTGERELYDLRSDPFELENRITDPAYDDAEAKLDARLDELRTRAPR